MRLGIVGHGKMGKMVEAMADDFGFQVCAVADTPEEIDERFRGLDGAIEFTEPGQALANIRRLAALGTNVTIGTTGWYDHLAEAKGVVDHNGTGLVYGANFSIGVAITRELVREAARRFQAFPEYQAYAFEQHHSAKKDRPSGTLQMLVNAMRAEGYDYPIDESSSRVGHVPGTHMIGFDSKADTVVLTHVARSREGFAAGALHAARWLAGKRGFYEFAETLGGKE